MNQSKITEKTEVSEAELSIVLGITGRRVRQLVEDGILHRSGKGRYLLCDSVRLFFAEREHSRLDAEDLRLDRERRAADVEIKSSRAAIARMEADELRGKMHRAEDVAAMTEDLVYTIRSALIALPGRVAIDVAAVNSSAEASEVIRKEVHKVMRELTNYHYDPKKYEERVRARMDWPERGSDEET